jgi:hypothetical protein
MGILDWHRHAELAEDAYRWGLKEIARLKEAGHPLLSAASLTASPSG